MSNFWSIRVALPVPDQIYMRNEIHLQKAVVNTWSFIWKGEPDGHIKLKDYKG